VPFVSVVVEGLTDAAVLQKLLAVEGFELSGTYGLRGKNKLDESIRGYNNAARFSPWLVLRDLDHDSHCAAALAVELLPHPAEQMRFRIAVRETESWLLADAEALASYLRVARSRVPGNPDELDDPKETLVNIARQSRSSAVVDDMVPREGMSGTVGPGYTARIAEFAFSYWRPDVARLQSNSLERCIVRLRELAAFS
jgi:hypothetical protein